MTRFNTSDGAYTMRVSGGRREPKWRGKYMAIADLPMDIVDGDTAVVSHTDPQMLRVTGGTWRTYLDDEIDIGDHVIVKAMNARDPDRVGRVIENTMKSDTRLAITYSGSKGIRVSDYVEPERLTRAVLVPASDIATGFLYGCKCGCGRCYE